jgi:YgiT-type zinc finger domain-containing protein
MQCVFCGHGETEPGTATVTLTPENTTIVIRDVPAEVCTTCGEEYVSKEIMGELLRIAREAARAGVQVDVRTYKVA